MPTETIAITTTTSFQAEEEIQNKAERVQMRQTLRQWLIKNIAAVLEIDPATIDVSRDLDQLGMDSLQAVCLAGDLEAWLGLEISETALWDYPTIESMCDYIMKKIPVTGSVTISAVD
jgi:acyl carrier protein